MLYDISKVAYGKPEAMHLFAWLFLWAKKPMPSPINLDNQDGAIIGEDITRLQDKSLQRALKKYNETSFDSLIKQVQAEYWLSWEHQNPRIQENLVRLKLYNNQRRDKDLVGEPLIFGIFQTLLAALYSDKMTVTWEGNEEGDEDTAENLNGLSEYDYKRMKKAVADFVWIWDALFFGRGLMNLEEFDRSARFMCPIPENYDSMTFIRDPLAVSAAGDIKGNGAMRFGGREIGMTKWQMKENGQFINLSELRRGNDIKSLLEQAIKARADAQGLQQLFGNQGTAFAADLLGNSEYNILEWKTVWKNKKVKVWLGNNLKTVVRYKVIGDLSKSWGLMDRPLYPTAHSWEGVSIPDLVEDKQRQRAVAMNLGLNILKSDLYPSYLYNEKMIKNPNDLRKIHESNKFIAVKGENTDVRAAMQPVNKFTVDKQLLNFILDSLDVSAQRATAAPDMAQGQLSNDKRTLGELNLVASKVDTRQGLAAKIFGWSEEAFWIQYYLLYKEHFADKIDTKVIRLNGAFGAKWRKLTKDQIIAEVDPDVTVEATSIVDAKTFKERVLLTAYGQLIINDPTVNKRYLEKRLGKLNGLKHDELERLFPPTVDELLAERENDKINEDKLPEIHVNDNHIVHWEIHSKAAETDAKLAHMEAHFQAMMIQKNQPELFPQAQPQQSGQPASNGTSDISQGAGGQPSNPVNMGALTDMLGKGQSALA